MKKLSILFVSFLFLFGLTIMTATNAAAWRIDVFSNDDYWGGMNVWYQITNDSTEGITAFAHGLSIPDGWEEFWPLGYGPQNSDVGDWFGDVVQEEYWVEGGYYAAFGETDWNTAFGENYSWAYVATPLTHLGNPGYIPGGTTFGSAVEPELFQLTDFGFIAYPFVPMSPVIALFEDSGVFFGSTNTDNPSPNPIPEPGTWLLMGIGLAALVAFRKRVLPSRG